MQYKLKRSSVIYSPESEYKCIGDSSKVVGSFQLSSLFKLSDEFCNHQTIVRKYIDR